MVGHPVAHSKSPEMYNAVFKELNLPWHYDRKDLVDEAEAQAFFSNPGWLALNITMPYKPLAYQQATHPSDYAQAAQGANVLIRTKDRLYADNTDGRGCVSFLERCGCNFNDARVIVCGTGPTSQSILFASAKAGARSAMLLSRTPKRALLTLISLKDRLSHQKEIGELQAGSYATAAPALEKADIIIDATPLGMQKNDPTPFDTNLLHEGQTVLDVVYGHGTTKLLERAREQGCKVYDGSGMLVAQAVQTVYDIHEVLDIPLPLQTSDLFTIMAKAAGFIDYSEL